MDAATALDRIHADLGTDLRVFVDVRENDIEVLYARVDIDNALEGATRDGAHEAHLRDIANALLTPGGTAAIRYTPGAIIVGMPRSTDDGTGYLLSLEHSADDEVDVFIDTLLTQGASIIQSTATGPATYTGDSEPAPLNDRSSGQR